MPIRNSEPVTVYEGDYMQQNGEYVTIYKRSTNPAKSDPQVGAIKLDRARKMPFDYAQDEPAVRRAKASSRHSRGELH